MTGNIPNSNTPKSDMAKNLFVQVRNLTCALFLPYVLRFDAIAKIAIAIKRKTRANWN